MGWLGLLARLPKYVCSQIAPRYSLATSYVRKQEALLAYIALISALSPSDLLPMLYVHTTTHTRPNAMSDP